MAFYVAGIQGKTAARSSILGVQLTQEGEHLGRQGRWHSVAFLKPPADACLNCTKLPGTGPGVVIGNFSEIDPPLRLRK